MNPESGAASGGRGLYPNTPIRGLAHEVVDAFRRQGLTLRVEQEVDDALTAVALVAGGFGLCITTQSATRLRLPGLSFRPLVDPVLRDLDLSCLYRRDDVDPVVMAFMDVVREFAVDPRRVRPR